MFQKLLQHNGHGNLVIGQAVHAHAKVAWLGTWLALQHQRWGSGLLCGLPSSLPLTRPTGCWGCPAGEVSLLAARQGLPLWSSHSSLRAVGPAPAAAPGLGTRPPLCTELEASLHLEEGGAGLGVGDTHVSPALPQGPQGALTEPGRALLWTSPPVGSVLLPDTQPWPGTKHTFSSPSLGMAFPRCSGKFLALGAAHLAPACVGAVGLNLVYTLLVAGHLAH